MYIIINKAVLTLVLVLLLFGNLAVALDNNATLDTDTAILSHVTEIVNITRGVEGDVATIQTLTAQNRTTILAMQNKITELENNQYMLAEGINTTETELQTAIGDKPSYFDSVIIFTSAMMLFTGFFFSLYLRGK